MQKTVNNRFLFFSFRKDRIDDYSYGKTNFLDEKVEGNSIQLLADNQTELENIEKIDLVIVYEIKRSIPKSEGSSRYWEEYTNWRCERTFTF